MASRLAVSRLVWLKRDAAKLAKRWQELGAVRLKVTGDVKHRPYMVRGVIELTQLGKFLCEEAREQQGK